MNLQRQAYFRVSLLYTNQNFLPKTLILLIRIFILKNAVIKGLKCIFSSGCKYSVLHKLSYKHYVNIAIFGYPSLIYNLFYKRHM